MQTTNNLGLKKPGSADVVDFEDFNYNADVLDGEVAKLASTTEAGRMSAADKAKLNGIAAGANNYTHPSSHPATMITQDSSNRFVTDSEKAVWNAKASTAAATSSASGLMSAADKAKLDGVAAGANNYTHPSSHPATMITQDSSNRFVTDTEKVSWNAKASTAAATSSAGGLMSAADKAKLDGIAAGAGTAGSATDTVIGGRTVADSSAPTGDSGTITTLLGWLGNMIKSITGKSSWRTAPATTLEAAKSHMDAVSAHGATSTATASRIMMRDASGRAQVAAPYDAADIARKDTVDGAVTSHKAESDPHGQYVKKAGDTMGGGLATAGIDIRSPAPMITWTETDFNNKKWYAVADGGVFSIRENTLGASVFDIYPSGDVRVKNSSMGLATTTASNMTFYVRTDGNDNNTGTVNTAAGAFRTITKAISFIPHVVNHTVKIFIGAGTYNEELALFGRAGYGEIYFYGDSKTTTKLPGAHINSCTCFVQIMDFNFTRGNFHAMWLRWNSRVLIGNCLIDGVSSDYAGINVEAGTASIVECTISNKKAAVSAYASAQVGTWNNTGSGNVNSYTATDGAGQITVGGSKKPSGNLLTATGGLIIPDAGVINPWGDNTFSRRSTVLAWTSSSQSVPSNEFIKLVGPFNTVAMNYLNEYNPSIGRFTAKDTGMYAVTAAISVNSTQNVDIELRIYKNGVIDQILAWQKTSASGFFVISGTMTTDLGAGGYIEIYMRHSQESSLSTLNDSLANYLRIVRVS